MAKRSASETLILFAAEGFGSGRFPVAPGTVGSLVGFVWVYLLLIPQNLWFYLAGIVGGFFIAIWLGERGEQISGRKDPGSIVIDEITAIPLAFLGAILYRSEGSVIPGARYFLEGTHLFIPLVTFIGFRYFDVAKPWIIGRSQRLQGGWGLVIDDFLAALHVVPISYVAARLL